MTPGTEAHGMTDRTDDVIEAFETALNQWGDDFKVECSDPPDDFEDGYTAYYIRVTMLRHQEQRYELLALCKEGDDDVLLWYGEEYEQSEILDRGSIYNLLWSEEARRPTLPQA
ncbi:hypothetical protein LCGC14_0163760 [marine sediment metagenome]|uniref:Uncharacterized protein n=1 Tax=marine sediment metagenome TaxID=412755 RepID=A0A0F9VAD0_9ZZZZ